MAQTYTYTKELTHLSRLGLEGKQEDVRIYLSRFVRKIKKKDEALFLELNKLLKEHSPLSEKSALRRSENDFARSDFRETTLENNLLRNPSVELIEKPILSPVLDRIVLQLLEERSRLSDMEEVGIAPTRSAIFTGPPGVGKTHTAKWIANQLRLPLLVLDVATVMSSFLGQTGANLKEALIHAKGSPCVLLLDEIDAIAKRRSDESDVGELKRLVTVILQEVDEWNSPSLLLAATNHKELIDPALWRRFDLVAEFELPSLSDIEDSINRFLASDRVAFRKYMELLKHSHLGMSYSDVEKSIDNLRRAKFLGFSDTKTLIEELAMERIRTRSKEDRLAAARALTLNKSASQRKISEMTGVHRTTLRTISKEQFNN